MVKEKYTCPVCSCFCNDIEVETENHQITKVENICLKGFSLLSKSQDKDQRTTCLVDGREVKVDQAVDEAAKLLSQSHNPLVFGLGHSTVEAQNVGLELAKRLGGVIDDGSSLSYGNVIEHILRGVLPTCSLSEIDKADLIIYWGSNPQHSHPRHLSEFAYYTHSEYSEVSTSRKITMCVVDVRETETALVSGSFFKLSPGDDRNFISSVTQGGERKLAKKRLQEFFDLLNQSACCIIFVGLGLVYSLRNDISPLIEMINRLNLNIKVIPMMDQPNMRGFNQCLYNNTGYVNRVSFGNGISSGSEYSFWEQIKNKDTDSVLILGADPFFTMPSPVIEHLKGKSLITIDPFVTATTKRSQVVLSPAISSLEASGTVVRMDGEELSLSAIKDTDRLSDEEILQLLLDRVDR